MFGLAVLGFVMGPMFGGFADLVGIRGSFVTVALVAAGLVLALAPVSPPPNETPSPGAIGRALRDRAFVGLDPGLQPYVIDAVLFGKGGLAGSGHLGTLYVKDPAALPRDLQERIARLLANDLHGCVPKDAGAVLFRLLLRSHEILERL